MVLLLYLNLGLTQKKKTLTMDIENTSQEIVLVGAGIMSATLGIFLQKLLPKAKLTIYERMDKVALESSAAWNNAGTGHSAFCELNYTPIKNGKVDLAKAERIGEQFEVSKQFWTYLKRNKILNPHKAFINDVDHMSFVWGADNVDFLSSRYQSMIKNPLFADMLYSEDYEEIQTWIPLMMDGRDKNQRIAATRMALGTDVNFGELTKGMIAFLGNSSNCEVQMGCEITSIKQEGKKWRVKGKQLSDRSKKETIADFVFIGAGGGALKLLEKTDIPEARGYGGFPVSGQWLRCNNPDIIKQHEAKVYGKADVGSPPMSVPHLDTRIIDGERCLLFGPYAGFSTKFLKNGSYLDLFLSVESHNIWPLLAAGYHNIDLTKYLVKQVLLSKEDRFKMLKQYYPEAKIEDWDVEIAGQRVQIIKKDEKDGGKLQFGTEIVCDQKGSVAALLGASPGASTSVSIMLELLQKVFPDNLQSSNWQNIIKEMIPSYGMQLSNHSDLLQEIRRDTTAELKLTDGPEEW